MNQNDQKLYKGTYYETIDKAFVFVNGIQITAFDFPESPLMPAKSVGGDTFRAGGFWWGYNGYSPLRLSYAILADYTGSDKIAKKYCEFFLYKIISNINSGLELNICGLFIKEWLEKIRKK